MVRGYEMEMDILRDRMVRAERTSGEEAELIARLRSDLSLSRSHEQQLEKALGEVTGSKFWKMTWPMRYVVSKSRQLWQVEMGGYSAMAAALPAVNMGEGPLVDQPLTVEGKVWKVTCISVGNPHCVTVVEDVDSLKLEAIGPAFEHHANFPERINTEFVQVVDAAHLKMRVWERGSGETWACGTGTCATVAALTELGICPAGQDIHVQLRGGELVIRVLPGRQLLMTGSAVTVYEGVAEV